MPAAIQRPPSAQAEVRRALGFNMDPREIAFNLSAAGSMLGRQVHQARPPATSRPKCAYFCSCYTFSSADNLQRL
jgi:hypothetical protein